MHVMMHMKARGGNSAPRRPYSTPSCRAKSFLLLQECYGFRNSPQGRPKRASLQICIFSLHSFEISGGTGCTSQIGPKMFRFIPPARLYMPSENKVGAFPANTICSFNAQNNVRTIPAENESCIPSNRRFKPFVWNRVSTMPAQQALVILPPFLNLSLCAALCCTVLSPQTS